jgi:hypothetical protein
VGGLSLHGEGDAIGGIGLDLNAGYKTGASQFTGADANNNSRSSKLTRRGVVEILVQELQLGILLVSTQQQWLSAVKAIEKAHIVGRLGDVGESSRSSHCE